MTINHIHFGFGFFVFCGKRAFLYKEVGWGTCNLAARVGALCGLKYMQVVGFLHFKLPQSLEILSD